MGSPFQITFEVYEVIFLPREEWKADDPVYFAEAPRIQYFASLESALQLARLHWIVPTRSYPEINHHGEPAQVFLNKYEGAISGLDMIVNSDFGNVKAELKLVLRHQIFYSHPNFYSTSGYGCQTEEVQRYPSGRNME